MTDPSWNDLIDGLVRGDSECELKFWQTYGPQLERLAEQRLGGPLRQRVDPVDIAQSVCRTFLRRARLGQFTLEDSRALWRLMCAITLNKIRSQARFHGRQKRGLGHEQHLGALAGTESSAGFDPAGETPSPSQAAEFGDQFEHVLAGLSEEDRTVVEMKLAQHSNAEIAERLDCTERTIRRLLGRIEERLTKQLMGPE